MKRFAALAVLIVVAGCKPDAAKMQGAPAGDSGPVASNQQPTDSSAPSANSAPAPETKPGANPDSGWTEQPAPTPGKAPSSKEEEQKQKVAGLRIPRLSQDGWAPSDLPPEQIASMVDASITKLEGAAGKAMLRLKDTQGAGSSDGEIKIESRRRYRITYPIIVEGRPLKVISAADGNRRAVLTPPTQQLISQHGEPGGWVAGPSFGQGAKLPPDDQLLESWPAAFPGLMFAPITLDQPVFSKVVSAAGRGVGGFTVQAQKRDVPFNGKIVTDYRLLIERADASKGRARVEMVISARFWLPVSIWSGYEKGKDRYESIWSAGWGFHQHFGADAIPAIPAKF